MKNFVTISLWILTCFFCLCNNPSDNLTETLEKISANNNDKNKESLEDKNKLSDNNESNKEEVLENSDSKIYNNIAKLIAGLSNVDSPDYKQYALGIDRAWNNLLDSSLNKIPSWTKNYISKNIASYNTVFYPFGGPDVSYALTFFPDANQYILVGLEPLGDFEKIKECLNYPKVYAALKEASTSYLEKGYFITSEMCTQLANNDIRGGLNLILLQLAHLNYDIVAITNGGIDENGSFVLSNKGNIDCIQIICKKDGFIKNIYYIRTDLENSNKKFDNLTNFVKNSNFITFIKSASYAMHNRSFSKIRSFILENSEYILQDDTGIPFYFFRLDWNCRAFGVYSEPTLPIFHSYKQQSLKKFFDESEYIEIPFKIGYGFRQGRPNLLLATPMRKNIEKQIGTLKNKKNCNCDK